MLRNYAIELTLASRCLVAPPCREFGISRVTGYKIFDRCKECGLYGIHDRSNAPYRQANELPFRVERAIVGIK